MISCACGGLTPIGASNACLHCDAPLRQPPRWALRLTALLGPAGAILLAACYGGPGRYYGAQRPTGPGGAFRMDHDGDGVPGGWECPQDSPAGCGDFTKQPPPPDADCDDADRTRYPGAQDIDGDGVDQNCDGVDGWRDPNVVAAPVDAGAGPDAP